MGFIVEYKNECGGNLVVLFSKIVALEFSVLNKRFGFCVVIKIRHTNSMCKSLVYFTKKSFSIAKDKVINDLKKTRQSSILYVDKRLPFGGKYAKLYIQYANQSFFR